MMYTSAILATMLSRCATASSDDTTSSGDTAGSGPQSVKGGVQHTIANFDDPAINKYESMMLHEWDVETREELEKRVVSTRPVGVPENPEDFVLEDGIYWHKDAKRIKQQKDAYK